VTWTPGTSTWISSMSASIPTVPVVVSVVIAIVTTLPATSLTSVEERPLAVEWPYMRLAKWSNGALIDVEYDRTVNPLVWLLEGQVQRTVPFTIPGARLMEIDDWDRAADGAIGLSGSATDAEGRLSGFIAWISPDGMRSEVIQTLLYGPMHLAFAPDGTIWTAGRETLRADSGVLRLSASVIRHFERSGKTLGSFVPQATILDRNVLYNIRSWLRASSDRVAWYSGGKYVELAPDGRLVADITIRSPGDETGFALTEKGEAFLSSEAGSQLAVHILDRSTGSWRLVLQRTMTPGSPIDFGFVCGADGSRLVLHGFKRIKFYNIGN
jgi:hypothetical protein